MSQAIKAERDQGEGECKGRSWGDGGGDGGGVVSPALTLPAPASDFY